MLRLLYCGCVSSIAQLFCSACRCQLRHIPLVIKFLPVKVGQGLLRGGVCIRYLLLHCGHLLVVLLLRLQQICICSAVVMHVACDFIILLLEAGFVIQVSLPHLGLFLDDCVRHVSVLGLGSEFGQVRDFCCVLRAHFGLPSGQEGSHLLDLRLLFRDGCKCAGLT